MALTAFPVVLCLLIAATRDFLQYRVFLGDVSVGSANTIWGLRQTLEGARE
jgi:hypothetical protein